MPFTVRTCIPHAAFRPESSEQTCTPSQELVRALYRRPGLAEALRRPDQARPSGGPRDLAALLAWLWPLTAAPERHLRADAQWALAHLADIKLTGGHDEDGSAGAAACILPVTGMPPAVTYQDSSVPPVSWQVMG